MKRVWLALLTGVICVSAATGPAQAKKKKAAAVAGVCAVSGEAIKDLKSAPFSTYQGKKYYFCCTDCKPSFDKDPAGYVKKLKDKTKKAEGRKSESLVCPVMGSKIESKEQASGSSVFEGKTYYFCCGGCKPEFDKDPASFVKKMKK